MLGLRVIVKVRHWVRFRFRVGSGIVLGSRLGLGLVLGIGLGLGRIRVSARVLC